MRMLSTCCLIGLCFVVSLAALPAPELAAWQAAQCWPGDSVVLGADGTVELLRDISDLRAGVAPVQPRVVFAEVAEFHACSWLMGSASTALYAQVAAASQLRLTLVVKQSGAIAIVGKFRISRATVQGPKFAATAALVGQDAGKFIKSCRTTLDGIWQNAAIK